MVNDLVTSASALDSAPSSLSEALLLALSDRDQHRRDRAIDEAAHAADPTDLIELVADHDDAGRRNAALEALAQGGARSVPSLIRALRHPDPEVVMFAAGTLGRTRDPAVIPHLVRLLDQEDLNVAQAAVDSLARLRATVAVGEIVKLLNRDPWLRFAAVHALGEIGDPHAVEALLPLLGDESVREMAIDALGKIGSVEALGPLAMLLRESEDAGSFASCLRAIGGVLEHHPDPGALRNIREWAAISSPEAMGVHQRIMEVLGAIERQWSDDLEIRTAAAAIIRALRLEPLYTTLVLAGRDPMLAEVLQFCAVSIGPEISPSLQTGLGERNAEVRVLACQCVGALGLSDCVPHVAALLTDPDEKVRAAAVHTLARLDQADAVSAIVRLLHDPAQAVREAARAALGRMDAAAVSAALLADPATAGAGKTVALEIMRGNPHPTQAAFLTACLDDTDPTVRRAAVAAAMRQPGDFLGTVEALLYDGDAAVRREAVRALGRSRGERVCRLLLLAIEHDAETRADAIRALGQAGDARAIGRLVALLSEQPPRRPAEIEALAALHESASEPLLVRLVADPEPATRMAAIQALGVCGSTVALRHVFMAVRDSDARVRRVVADAVSRCCDTALLETLIMDSDASVALAARRHLEDLEKAARHDRP
ncbi:MAG TPA: HEAT repeat domain-containing protein [Polyangia bacterium]|jgi:HEAT repeat protein